jgi:DNA processing protein
MVAVVGTRGARRESTDLAHDLAAGVAEAGYVVVSGGAIGVDAAAHTGALDAGGLTVAVLGSGLDRPYPERNLALFARIVTGRGALVSPYPVGTPPRRGNFPARNKLVAALARVVVVVEAPLRSGALNTARHARELGVPVLAAAHGHGALGLLRAGAGLVERAADVLHVLNGGPPRTHREPPDDPDAARLLDLLRAGSGLRVDEVAHALGWTPSRSAASLLRLEVEGWVCSRPGGLFEVFEG